MIYIYYAMKKKLYAGNPFKGQSAGDPVVSL
jgi:hypothetical protein